MWNENAWSAFAPNIRSKHHASVPEPRWGARKAMRWMRVPHMNGMNETLVVGLLSR